MTVPSASHTTRASPRLSIVIASFSRSASIRACAPSRRSAIVLNAVSSSRSSCGPLGLDPLGQVARGELLRRAHELVERAADRADQRRDQRERAQQGEHSRAGRREQGGAAVVARLVARVGTAFPLAGGRGPRWPAARRRWTRPAGARRPARGPRPGPGSPAPGRGAARSRRARTRRRAARIACRRGASAWAATASKARAAPAARAARARRRARGTTSPRSRPPRAAATRPTRARSVRARASS